MLNMSTTSLISGETSNSHRFEEFYLVNVSNGIMQMMNRVAKIKHSFDGVRGFSTGSLCDIGAVRTSGRPVLFADRLNRLKQNSGTNYLYIVYCTP